MKKEYSIVYRGSYSDNRREKSGIKTAEIGLKFSLVLR